MKFIDRTQELTRLHRLSNREEGGVAVLWGRRRIGKTRILLEWTRKEDGLYFVADQSAATMQRRYAAQGCARRFSGFDAVEYPTWRSLLGALTQAARAESWRGPLVIDELPYWVAQDKSLPSVLQAWLDHEVKEARLTVAFCGSAQHMMQGLTLDHSAPLFGRAAELMKIPPIRIGHFQKAMPTLCAVDIIRMGTLWGGIPRYWELAEPFGPSLDEACVNLLLDPLGVLHDEPGRLLSMELPSATSLRPILDAIGLGAHKISEVAGRLGLTAPALSGQMARLVELGLVKREVPFGESEKKSKKSLYKIADPLMRAWFRLVAPNRAFLTATTPKGRADLFTRQKKALHADGFEELARESVPLLPEKTFNQVRFGPAGRYWAGNGPEWDVVALSEDGGHLLLGEVKWHDGELSEKKVDQAVQALLKKGVPRALDRPDRRVIHAVFVPGVSKAARKARYSAVVVGGEEMVGALV